MWSIWTAALVVSPRAKLMVVPVRVVQDAGQNSAAVGVGLDGQPGEVSAQDVVALVAAVPVDVSPCLAELVAAVARHRCAALHGERRGGRECGTRLR